MSLDLDCRYLEPLMTFRSGGTCPAGGLKLKGKEREGMERNNKGVLQ